MQSNVWPLSHNRHWCQDILKMIMLMNDLLDHVFRLRHHQYNSSGQRFGLLLALRHEGL